MKTLIFSLFIAVFITSCGAKRKANCDAYSENKLNHINVDTLTKQADLWTDSQKREFSEVFFIERGEFKVPEKPIHLKNFDRN